MDDAQRAYCKQLRPLVEKQLLALRKLAERPQEWHRVSAVGGTARYKGVTTPDVSKTLSQLAEKEMIERRNEGHGNIRPLWAFRITPLGLAYLEYIMPVIASGDTSTNYCPRLTKEDFSYINLLPTDMKVLRILATLPTGMWQMTKSVGGTNKSHHAIYVKRLYERHLIDRVVWGNFARPSYRCRINDNGLRYLAFLDQEEK